MRQGEHAAILTTFIKLPLVIKTFVLSIFEWPFYTGFTVQQYCMEMVMQTMEASSEILVLNAYMTCACTKVQSGKILPYSYKQTRKLLMHLNVRQHLCHKAHTGKSV